VTPAPEADRLAILLVLVLAALAVVLGLRAGWKEVDVDELVYRRTLVSMQHGDGYYHAMGKALERKEGAPPSQVRSIRPPTLFLLLSRFPSSSWRWLVGAVYLGTLLCAWRIGRPLDPWGGPLAVGLTGIWLLGAAPLLFLHSELWGVPLVLGGALAFRNRRWLWAAVLLGLAVLFRETYIVALLAGLVWAGRRRPFLLVLGVLAVAAAVHVHFAQQALSAHGREPAFGASGLSPRYILSSLGPSDRPLGWVVGIVADTAGLAAVWLLRKRDGAAVLVLTMAAVLIPATVFLGRQYWGLTFGPALASFAPGVLPPLRMIRSGDA